MRIEWGGRAESRSEHVVEPEQASFSGGTLGALLKREETGNTGGGGPEKKRIKAALIPLIST